MYKVFPLVSPSRKLFVVHLYMFNAGDDTVLVIGLTVGLGAVTMFCNILYLAGRPKQVPANFKEARTSNVRTTAVTL